MKKIKLVISDCHLSAGLNFESQRNPHEDFFFDDEMVAFVEYFSSNKYGNDCEVELIINGDFFDFLNVPYRGEFEENITEQFALYKFECILSGHSKVIEAFKKFAAQPNKFITYNIGNHDAEFFFEKVRQRFIKIFDNPDGSSNPRIRTNWEKSQIRLPGGVLIYHGNQFEAVHYFDYEKPFISNGMQEPILNLPWGSFYVLKIVNRLKWERDYVDKVRPIKAMILWGLVFDTWFTLKYSFLSVFYFLKTRFFYSPKRRSRFKVTAKILRQETTTFLQNLERESREVLNQHEDVHTVIMGHTHLPMHKVYPDGRSYINTGTWTRMINLDLRGIGGGYKLTFALIEYDDKGVAQASLQQWIGEYKPYKPFSK